MSKLSEVNIKGIPDAWELTKLKDVCKKIIGGGTPSTKETKYWNGDIPWISSADIEGLREIYPRRRITREAVENSATNILPKGGIIIVTRVGLGKLAIAPYDICFSQDNQGLILKEDVIDKSYALIYLSKAVQNFKHESRGTTINGVTKKQLQELNIPLPPLLIQKQIVSKIEELFSELDKGIEELKTAQQQLKVYRQAVLKWAFENIEQKEYQSVENCCTRIVDCLHSTAKFSPTGFYCIDTTCIDNGKILFEKVRYVDEQTYTERISRLKPEEGDILFAREGTVGTTLIVPPKVDLCLGQRMMMFRLEDNVDSKYFMYFFQSTLFKTQYKPLIMGTTAPHLNIRDIKRFEVIICPIEEQQKLVQEIESRLSVCDKIEETITDSLKQAEALRQSILKKAFEGKLQ